MFRYKFILVFFLLAISFPRVVLSTSNINGISLTQAEKEFIKEHPQVVLGAGSSFEPFIIINQDGSFAGYDIDIIHHIEKSTGLDIRLEIGVWDKVQEKAKSREIDGLLTAVQTKERERLFYNSVPYVQFTNLVIVKKGNPPEIFGLEDIPGKTVALQNGNEHFIRVLEQLDVVVKIELYDTIHEVVSAVVSGKADFTILDETAPYIAKKLGLGGNVEAAFTVGKPYDLMFLTRNDWPELITIINKGLRAIDEKERIEIRDFWFGSINTSINYGLIQKTSLVVFILLGVALFWAYTLNISKRKIEQAFRELELKEQELEEKNITLTNLSVTDQLTQISNRLMLDQSLEKELIRAERYQGTFGIIMIDIDDFKEVNDTHGHQVGDQVLIEIAELLTRFSRDVDIVGRWGGEEFLVISPENGRDGLFILAENLRRKVEQHDFSVIKNKTISLGCSMYWPTDDMNSLINRADKALYRAKSKGKNCVVNDHIELTLVNSNMD